MTINARTVSGELFRLAGEDSWYEVENTFFWGDKRLFSEELNAWIEGEEHDRINDDTWMVFSVEEAETGVKRFYELDGYYSSYGDGTEWDGDLYRVEPERRWVVSYVRAEEDN